MALGQRPNPQLLDILRELNALVKTLQSDDFSEIIDELNTKTEAAKKAETAADMARESNETSISNLETATAENMKTAQEAKKQREALEAVKIENDRAIQKLTSIQEGFDAGRKAFEKRTAATNDDLTAKSQRLSERERKVSERQAAVDALRKEYESKLADLKKITG